MSLLTQVLGRLGLGARSHALAWRAPQTMDRGRVGGACLALDRHGRGLVLWVNQGDLRMMSMGESKGVIMASFPVGSEGRPAAIANDRGLGAALWVEDHGPGIRLKGSPFNVSCPTFEPTMIFEGTGRIRHLQAAVDRRGSTLAVWCLEQEGRWDIQAQAFDPRTGAWHPEPVRLGSSLEHALVPRLASNRRGRAMVVWEVQEPAFEGIMATHYWPSERAWSDAAIPGVASLGQELQLAMDDRGNALALWIARPRAGARLEASRFEASEAAWERPEVLASGHVLEQLALAGTGDGQAFVLWQQKESSGPPRLMSRRLQDRVWRDTQRVDGDGIHAKACALACQEGGPSGILLVHSDTHGDSVHFRTWEDTLGPPVALTLGPRGTVSQPLLALSPRSAVAAWRQGDGPDARIVVAKGE